MALVVLVISACQPGSLAWLRPSQGSMIAATMVSATPSQALTDDPVATPLPTYPSSSETPLPAYPPDVTATRVPPVPSGAGTPLYLPFIIEGIPPQEVSAPTLTPTIQATPKPTKPKATRTPKPTRTPEVPWPEPLQGPSRSKLGVHIQWNNSPDIMEFIRRMKPAVVKGMGDLGYMEEVKIASPSTVTVARFSQNVPMEGDPVQAARAFVAQNLAEYKRHPGVDYWEGINEPGVQGEGRMAWFAAFEAERVRVMAENGLHTAIGAFSTGVPEWEQMAEFLPAIEAAKKYGGILSLHEYDAPLMDRSIGMALPGRPGYPNRGVLTLRYRWWYEDFLKPRGLVIPLVISEAGVDGAVGEHPGPKKALGWQDFAQYWVQQGLTKDPIRFYLQQLTWYDSQVQQDDYVIGFAVFTAGPMNDDWKSFDITSILRHIANYVILPNK